MKTVIYNGNIYLQKGEFVQAILIEDGIVKLTGTNDTVLENACESTLKIDAKGNAVIPGFNDSHLHLYNLGRSLQCIKLQGLDSIDKMINDSINFIRENNIQPGTFVVGRGWNQDYFVDEKRLITRHDLDKISTEHPMLFTRACGHMAVCNTKALELCNVDKNTPNIEGAEICKDENGELNGIFTEHAISLISDKIPKESVEEMKNTIKTAVDYALSHGITSIHTNDINEENYVDMFKAYDSFYRENKFASRAYHQCTFSDVNKYEQFLENGFKTGFGTEYNKIGPLKIFVDGSLGARTALLSRPYADDATTEGLRCMTQEYLNKMVAIADKNDCQVAVHAIGDAANESVLNSYEEVIERGNNKNRHGIVHCQILREDILSKFFENDVLAYVQPIFLHYDMHIVEDRVGKELEKTSYVFGDMYRMGIKTSYGTDCPVEDLNTMENLYCAISRKDLKGYPNEGFRAEQGVLLEEAIEQYTHRSAYFSFEEDVKGKLKAGYYGDAVIFDKDIFNIDIEDIKNVTIVKTIVGGSVAFERK